MWVISHGVAFNTQSRCALTKPICYISCSPIKNLSLNSSLGNQKWLFCGIAFKSVVEQITVSAGFFCHDSVTQTAMPLSWVQFTPSMQRQSICQMHKCLFHTATTEHKSKPRTVSDLGPLLMIVKSQYTTIRRLKGHQVISYPFREMLTCSNKYYKNHKCRADDHWHICIIG